MRRLKTKIYNELRNELATLFPTQLRAQEILINSDINQGKVNLGGAAIHIWESVLSYAEQEGKLESLVKAAMEDSADRPVLTNASLGIKNKSAFIPDEKILPLVAERNELAAKIFLIYDLKDITIVKALKAQLKIYELNGTMRFFDMHTNIVGGQDKHQTRMTNLADSDIMLTMLSSSFFSGEDESCLPLTFAAFEMRKIVIPVLLSSCLWNRLKLLANIVPLPADFVSTYAVKDEALMEIAEGVGRVVDNLHS